METHTTDVCIVGGGPAGMVLALLLAHKGVNVLVLEQHKDFEREYRGEVLMPRFTQMFRQLGLDRWLLTLDHLKFPRGEIYSSAKRVGELDFSWVAPDTPYALWMPQPVLLRGLHERARDFPSFGIWFGTTAKSLLRNAAGAVEGVRAVRDGAEVEIRAKVTVGADGRYSTVLKDGGFVFDYEDYQFDVLWFTMPKPADYDNTFRFLFSANRSYLLLPKYPDAIQVGMLVQPGGFKAIRDAGLEKLREELTAASPFFRDYAPTVQSFNVIHPLQAVLHNMREWAKDGCLLIGDAAHCCSPAGAIGVSIAVGTAIVAADVILKALPGATGPLPASTLAEVQRIRAPEVREVHRLQRALTGGPLGRLIPARRLIPVLITLLARTPFLRSAQRRLMTLRRPLPFSPDLRMN